MNKYLLEILKDTNTVIIPGLGALTITNKETGEMMFMPYLQHDDGKLSAFIAEKDGVDETDAKNIVAKYVREIKAELDKGESFAMFQLGTFSKKEDGDIEFDNWDAPAAEEETPTPAAPVIEETPAEEEPVAEEAPVVEPEPEVADEPADAKHQEEGTESDSTDQPESEPVIEQPVAENEQESVVIPEPEAEIAPEPITASDPEPANEPEPIVDVPIVEVPPIIEPEPVIEQEPIVSEEPTEILENTYTRPPVEEPQAVSEPEDFITEKTTLEPSPLLDDIAPTSAVALDPEIPADVAESEETDGESEEEEEKKKAGVGFWVTLIVVALGIIAGGAYVGRNYNELKQHIPFLADKDEEAEKKSLKDEISNVIKEDKYAKPDSESTYEAGSDEGEEGYTEEGQDEGMDSGSEETTDQVTPEPEVTTPKVTTPDPVNISPSSGGPYKVIAGAFSSQENANRLSAEFKAQGLNSEVFMKGELHAVSIQSYATSEEANANLSKLQSKAPGAWIYYKR
jgi:cell division protein FtsN/nucleoid DNA-binding protein